MALQSSGQISLNDIHVEVGGSSGSEVSLNDTDVRALISKSAGAQNAINEYYGASAETDLGDSVSSQINGQNQLHQITVSNYISSGGTLRIPSDLWVWTNSTGTAAMTIDIPCTIINEGKIIGCGGNGGYTARGVPYYTAPGAGGPAINVTSSGVTITNSSGAYIAGGGGGGGGSADYGDPQDYNSGGGGGAGGGAGGQGEIGNPGAGGILNASGGHTTHRQTGNVQYSNGGGAGGGAGGSDQSNAGGGGGGRILPGTGGYGGYNFNRGGSAGNAGEGGDNHQSGGGGGWGAAGGSGRGTGNSGGAGGAAITGTSRTLTNNGTIYGST